VSTPGREDLGRPHNPFIRVETNYQISGPMAVALRSIVSDQMIRRTGLSGGATQDVSDQVKAGTSARSELHKNAERLAQVGHWHWDLRDNRVSVRGNVSNLQGSRIIT
jgi:hypothetical protein